MRKYDLSAFLPMTPEELSARGADRPDFVLVTGDAYVDHPSFGPAIIGRVLESMGYQVAMLAQPGWKDCEAFKRFGRPRLGFFVTAGNIDSMVAHYTAAKKRRGEDAYSPGGRAGMRPDRAVIVYCNRIREAYGDIPIAIGGLEASLRRFAHYDYWSDRVRASILADSTADILSYGMGERQTRAIADMLADGVPAGGLDGIAGTCVMRAAPPEGEHILCPSFDEVKSDRFAYSEAAKIQFTEQDAVRGRTVVQPHGMRYLIQYPPARPLDTRELDEVYALPYTRAWHPSYDDMGGVPGLSEVEFSITSCRGCFGGCNFCSLSFHQGRTVTSRSHESIIKEAEAMVGDPDFKGYIHDVGGPTANFRRPSCEGQKRRGVCKNRQCLFPRPCPELVADHGDYISLLRKLRAIEGVKKVFIRSGIRFDYVMADNSSAFLTELCRHHISGQLKVAPEHCSAAVLSYMGKPDFSVYRAFCERFKRTNERLGKKQFLVPYLMSSHPGSTLNDAIELALYLKEIGHRPEQVQDFYPTPGTVSTAMFYTGLDPMTGEEVYVPRTDREKKMQRALLQYAEPKNRAVVLAALREAGREDLIGYGRGCLVPPEGGGPPERGKAARRFSHQAGRAALDRGRGAGGKARPDGGGNPAGGSRGKKGARPGKNKKAKNGGRKV